MRVVVRWKPRRDAGIRETPCPSDGELQAHASGSLPRGRRGHIGRHILRCAVCEAKLRLGMERLKQSLAERFFDAASARLAAGALAALMLAGGLHIASVRRLQEFSDFAPAPLFAPARTGDGPVYVQMGGLRDLDLIPTSVRRLFRRLPRYDASLAPVVATRIFVPPQSLFSRPVLMAIYLDTPPLDMDWELPDVLVPFEFPQLPAPRRGPLRRLAAILTVPFRHL